MAFVQILAPVAFAATAPTSASSIAVAATSRPASLVKLLNEAATQSPGLLAARQRFMAARERVAGEGLRPDPMVEAGVMSLIGFMGPQLTVGQTFPLGAKLDLARRQAELEAEVARHQANGELNALLSQVKQVYFDLAYFQRSAAIVERNKLLVQQLGKIAGAKYSVGQGKQSDVVRTNTELADMLQEALLVRQQREGATARLLGLVNRRVSPAPIQVIDAELPRPPARPVVGRSLTEAIAMAESQNPDIAMAKAELTAAENALALARTIGTPDVTARLGVSRSYMDMGWQTALTGMVGTNLPFESGKREAAAVAAAEADVAARQSTLDERRRQIAARIAEVLSHLRHYEEQVALYARGILPQSRQALQSELVNYQVNKSDFDAVLSAHLALLRYEREEHEAMAEYQKMLAELEMLTGSELAARVQESK